MPFLRARGSRPSRKAAGVQFPWPDRSKRVGEPPCGPAARTGIKHIHARSEASRRSPPRTRAPRRKRQAPGFAAVTVERMIAGQKPVEVTRAWITEAGRTTLRVEKC
jgi:hypothetical protein